MKPLTIRVPAVSGTFIHKNYCPSDDCPHEWKQSPSYANNLKTCEKCGMTKHNSLIDKPVIDAAGEVAAEPITELAQWFNDNRKTIEADVSTAHTTRAICYPKSVGDADTEFRKVLNTKFNELYQLLK